MPTTRSRLRRHLTRLLARRRGSAAALRDLEQLNEVLRFSLLFTLLILLPVVLLALLALRSIQAEEIVVDAGSEQRAEAITIQVQDSLRSLLDEFEDEARASMSDGDAALQQMQAIGLRGAFRFDANGELVSPFVWPGPDDTWPDTTAAYEQALTQATRLDREGGSAETQRAWERATRLATAPAHHAEARLGAARALARANDPRADSALVLTANEFPTLRDRRGVRVADIANTLRADLAERTNRPEDAARIRRGIVDHALAADWKIGFPADGFVAERALEALAGTMDESARKLALDRVRARASQLYEAAALADELRVASKRQGAEGEFVYTPETKSLWASVAWKDGALAFAFDYDALRAELQHHVVDVANRIDSNLSAELRAARDTVDGTLARRSLAPDLPALDVIVRNADPTALITQRSRSGLQRRLVIALALLAVSIGVFAAVRTVGREVEGARAKADFAANVSHELRSPITQIRLKGEALQLDLVYDDADRQAHYDAIVRECERLSRLVDNVLDFSAIERGVKKYTLRAEDLGEIIVRSVEACRSAADAASLKLAVSLPDALPVVWVDREAIGQVMTNLLSNAIKYGSDGKLVEVVCRITVDGAEVSVTDHGIGIGPDDQAKIFEHFYRVQSSEVRRRRGTGIGLTIVRYIVEAHGGTIAVQSAIGEGSTFTVTLPTQPPKGAGG